MVLLALPPADHLVIERDRGQRPSTDCLAMRELLDQRARNSENV
jgi:hypothetical protein